MNALMNTYNRQPVGFTHGQGVWMWNAQGRRYLDGLSGIAVNTLGHNHPRFVAGLRDQVGRLIHTSNLYEVPLQSQLAEILVRLSGMSNVFFCNSGLEANETILRVNAAASALQTASYEAGMYVGAGCPLTPSQLSGLAVTRYWHSCSRALEPARGYCMRQLRPDDVSRFDWKLQLANCKDCEKCCW